MIAPESDQARIIQESRTHFETEIAKWCYGRSKQSPPLSDSVRKLLLSGYNEMVSAVLDMMPSEGNYAPLSPANRKRSDAIANTLCENLYQSPDILSQSDDIDKVVFNLLGKTIRKASETAGELGTSYIVNPYKLPKVRAHIQNGTAV